MAVYSRRSARSESGRPRITPKTSAWYRAVPGHLPVGRAIRYSAERRRSREGPLVRGELSGMLGRARRPRVQRPQPQIFFWRSFREPLRDGKTAADAKGFG